MRFAAGTKKKFPKGPFYAIKKIIFWKCKGDETLKQLCCAFDTVFSSQLFLNQVFHIPNEDICIEPPDGITLGKKNMVKSTGRSSVANFTLA